MSLHGFHFEVKAVREDSDSVYSFHIEVMFDFKSCLCINYKMISTSLGSNFLIRFFSHVLIENEV